MAHPSLNNQQQQSMMNTGSSSSQQRAITSKPGYQHQSPNTAQLSHMQHQQQPPQMLSGYSSQKPAELPSHQYSSNMMNLNGNAYTSVGGASIHTNVNADSHMNMHKLNQNPNHQFSQQKQQHSHQQPLQPQQQPKHYQTNPMSHNQQLLHHHQNQPPQSQKAPQQLMQQTQQFGMHQSGQNQTSQAPHSSQLKTSLHQQAPTQQPYIHNVQQRHSHQQQQQQVPKFDRTQPRRILQNTHSGHRRTVAKDLSNNQFPFPEMSQPKEPPQPQEQAQAPTEKIAAGVSEGSTEDDTGNSNKENKEIDDKETENEDQADKANDNKELANTKEKTPMTLVQELAKFNKIDRKYTLLDEQGPAHKKTFYVKLQLGTEEYSSSGPSIRKAQQSAAANALKETQYKHPPQKPAWKIRKETDADGKLTPTVELNGLAMKRGEAATYKAIEPQQPPYYYPPDMDPRALYGPRYYHHMRARGDPRFARGYWPMRYHYPRMSRGFYVSLRVGHREFIGDGPTRQAARHNAAVKALKVLKNLPEKEVKVEEKEPEEEEIVDDADGLKSRVTSVHEIAFRRKLTVNFEVIRESGPPHMKIFVTRCFVGDMVTEGEGNSKKLSKKIAAEEMYEKLKDLGPLPPSAVKPKQKAQVYKKKNRIKAEIQQQKADPNYGVGVNPISRLIQIMCAQKKKEPDYTLLAERGVSCRKEFIMQIQVEGEVCTGSGPNKKLAKRAAAEAMLDLLGYNKPSPQPAKSSIKQPSTEGHGGNGEKKVTFSESCQKGPSSEAKPPGIGHQQKVPGLIHLPSKTIVSTPAAASSLTAPAVVSTVTTAAAPSHKEPVVNLSSILKPSWRPELQLRELCKALNYPVEMNDMTKSQPNNSIEYISRISVGASDNQQSFLGSSTSLESARDIACMDALKVLMARIKEMHPAGDGSSHMKKTVLARPVGGVREAHQ